MDTKEELIQQVSDAIHSKRNRRRVHRNEEDGSAWALLRYLNNAEGEVNPTDLCQVMNVTTPRITTILNDMEEKGLISRQISANDRRRICVTLTKKGKDKIARGKKKMHDRLARLIDMVGEDDIRAYLRVLAAEEQIDKEEI